MKSSEVSFMPPLKPLVRGVRMASVMTTSSAFFWVLLTVSELQTQADLSGESGLHCRQSTLTGAQMAENGAESFSCHDRRG